MMANIVFQKSYMGEIIHKASENYHIEGRLNIGIFTDTYTPDINGVSVSVEILRRQLEKLGHNVFVITTSLESKFSGITYENGVLRIHGIRLKKLYNYRMSMPYSIAAKKYLDAMKLDIIHVHTEFGIGIFGRLYAKSRNIPLVYTYHTMLEDYTHYITKGTSIDPGAKKLVRTVSRAYCNNASAVIAPTEKTKNTLLRYGAKSEIHVIPTGVDISNFSPENIDFHTLSEFRKKYGLENKFTVLYLGRLAPEKSVEVLIDGIKKLSEKRNDIKLLIVGLGPSLEPLKEYANNQYVSDIVEFTGRMEYSEVPIAYWASDIFATASLTETQGLTYIEALAAGLCVLARMDEASKIILKDGVNGFYFTDSDSFAEKVLHYINLPTEQKDEMRKKCLDTAMEFSADTYGKNVDALYHSILNNYKV